MSTWGSEQPVKVNLFPIAFVDNVRDHASVDSKSACQGSAIFLNGGKTFPNNSHLGSRQFVRKSPAFAGAVLHVVCLSSEPKVSRVYAGGVVPSGAIVKNEQAFWNWPKMQNPRCSVRSYQFFTFGGNLSVSSGHDAANPNPTTSGYADLSIKTNREVLGKPLLAKILRSNINQFHISLPVCLSEPPAFSMLSKH